MTVFRYEDGEDDDSIETSSLYWVMRNENGNVLKTLCCHMFSNALIRQL